MTSQHRRSYFSGEFDGLTLKDLVRAFGTKAQADAFEAAVPELLKESGFQPMRWDRDGEGCNGNPCIAFTPSPVPILTTTQQKIMPGLRFFGELTVLGVTAAAQVVIDPSVPYLLVEAKLNRIELGNGALKLVRSSEVPWEGPLLRIEIMLAEGRPPAAAAIASGITELFKSGASAAPAMGAKLRDAFSINASGVIEAVVMLWGASVAVDIDVGNDGFTANFETVIGTGGSTGGGFAVDVAISAPFEGVEQLSFDATATLQADFGDAIGAAASDAILTVGAAVATAAEDVRDVTASAMAMLQDTKGAEIIKATLETALTAAIEKGKALLAKCTGAVCETALSAVVVAYDAAVHLAQQSVLLFSFDLLLSLLFVHFCLCNILTRELWHRITRGGPNRDFFNRLACEYSLSHSSRSAEHSCHEVMWPFVVSRSLLTVSMPRSVPLSHKRLFDTAMELFDIALAGAQSGWASVSPSRFFSFYALAGCWWSVLGLRGCDAGLVPAACTQLFARVWCWLGAGCLYSFFLPQFDGTVHTVTLPLMYFNTLILCLLARALSLSLSNNNNNNNNNNSTAGRSRICGFARC
jgi:hypothetical protein